MNPIRLIVGLITLTVPTFYVLYRYTSRSKTLTLLETAIMSLFISFGINALLVYWIGETL